MPTKPSKRIAPKPTAKRRHVPQQPANTERTCNTCGTTYTPRKWQQRGAFVCADCEDPQRAKEAK